MSGPLEAEPIVLALVDGKTILDVACGSGRLGCLMRTNWFATHLGDVSSQPDYLVGIDIFLPSLKRVKYYRIYDEIVQCDTSFLPFRENSFDVVLASEVLEHVERERGLLLLKEVERVSKRTIILTTLRFPGKRGGILLPEGFNPHESHVSKWTVGKLRSMGYQVFGIPASVYTIRSLRHRKETKVYSLIWVINSVLGTLSYVVPYLGWGLVGMKHKKPTELSEGGGTALGYHWKGERLLPTQEFERLPALDQARYNYSEKFVNNSPFVLDYGCGAGYGTDHLANEGCELAVGLDVSREAVCFARKRYRKHNLEFINADANYAPLRDNIFQLVVSLEVVEHLNSPANYCKEVRRVMVRNGVAVISTPNKWLHSPGLSKPVSRWHLKEYYPNEFKSLLGSYFTCVTLLGIGSKYVEIQASIDNAYKRIRKLNFVPAWIKVRSPRLLKRLIIGSGYNTKFDEVHSIKISKGTWKTSPYVLAVCTKGSSN
jgi:ubiquinone/menaquinone biosynthesis C-methylase UbiE